MARLPGADSGVVLGDSKDPDWRATNIADDDDPDDELLDETPSDVIAVLGFDPVEEFE